MEADAALSSPKRPSAPRPTLQRFGRTDRAVRSSAARAASWRRAVSSSSSWMRRDGSIQASRRAREVFEQLVDGEAVPDEVLAADGGQAFSIEYDAAGRGERLLYLRSAGDLAAYEELRAGFTAAVSHELRTPLARLLVILESAELPDTDLHELIEQARGEVAQIGELIDDVLFLSELETGRQVVGLGSTPRAPDPRRRRRRARGTGGSGRHRPPARGRRRRRAAAPAAHDPSDRLEPGRQRDPLRRPRRDADALRSAERATP